MKHTFIKPVLFATALLASLFSSLALHAQTLAQEPLLSKTIAVRPNLTFIMDESGSMGWECIYTKNAQSSFGTLKYGLAYNCLKDDNDNNVAQLSSSDFRFTSPDNNSIMYDPRKYYTTGFSETGTANPASTAPWSSLSNATVSISGNNNTGRAVYLAKVGSPVPTSTNASVLNNATQYDTYWLFNDGTNFGYKAAGLTITSKGTTNLLTPKPASRTDCKLNANYCTYAEELQNLRNWYTYHRTRLLAAKVGVSTAFTGLPDSFRMNYGSLGEITRSAINLPNSSITPLRPVNNYNNNINPFRKWLADLTTANSVGTPLRQALDIVGKNYQSTANSGPWGNTPWNPGNESASSHISCRRSFAILTTDGQWNNGVDPIKDYSIANSSNDTDGTNGSLITHLNSTAAAPITYRYTAHDTADARNKGKADKTSGTGYNNTLADIALNYWARDLRTLPNNVTDGKPTSPPFWQNMSTYSIGFGVNGSLTQSQIDTAKAGTTNWSQPVADSATAIDDLIHAAHNGGGEFIPVSDATEFSVALRKILLSITGETSSQAGVAASTTALQTGTKKYVPYYITGEWWGNVKSVNLNVLNAAENGIAWQVVATDANGRPTGTSTIPSPTTRNVIVYTDNTSKGVDFTYLNLSTNGLIASSATPVSNKLINTFDADQVDFIRGVRTKEGAGQPYRERLTLLGDIVNSRPAFVKNNSDPYSLYFKLPISQGGGPAYTTYKASKAARAEGVLFIGANDGMLHGFRESDGKEVLAFIPRSVLGGLHKLTDKNYPLNHQFFVDGPVKEADAYIQAPLLNGSAGSSLRWTNLVVGSTGAGAKAVYALDVTKPTSTVTPPTYSIQGKHVMWEVSNLSSGFAELGSVMADVETGVTPSGDWVAVFGNGYDSLSGKASLFLVNLSTGAKIRELTAGTATTNGLGGVRLVRNANSKVIGAYAGDLKGNVWRFDLTGTSSSNWKDGQLLYTALGLAGQPQPITAAPAVFARNDNKPGYIVVVGTGKLLTVADTVLTPTPPTQSTYGLWDEKPFGSATAITTISGRSALVGSTSAADATSGYFNVTNVRPINWTTDKGWYLDFTELVGQRSIYPLTALKTLVSIETIAPKASTGSCSIEGDVKAVNYLLSPYSGACKTNTETLDINKDNDVTSSDGFACAYSSLGDGTNTVVNKTISTGTGTAGGDSQNGDPGGLKYSIGTDGEQLFKDDDPNIPPGGGGSGCVAATDPYQCKFRRDVRQIFIRK